MKNVCLWKGCLENKETSPGLGENVVKPHTRKRIFIQDSWRTLRMKWLSLFRPLWQNSTGGVAYKPQKFISQFEDTGGFRGLVRLLPGWRWLPSRCALTWWVGCGSSLRPLSQWSSSHWRGSTLMPSTPLEVPSTNAITFGGDEFWGDTSIQIIMINI